jgi:hypothetical protein
MRVLDPHISDSHHATYSAHVEHTNKYESPGSSLFVQSFHVLWATGSHQKIWQSWILIFRTPLTPPTACIWMTPTNMRVQDPHYLCSHSMYCEQLVHTNKNESPGSSYFGVTAHHLQFASGVHQQIWESWSPGFSYFGLTSCHLQCASGWHQKIWESWILIFRTPLMPPTVCIWSTPINMRVLDPHILDSSHAICNECLLHTGKYESPGPSHSAITSHHVPSISLSPYLCPTHISLSS